MIFKTIQPAEHLKPFIKDYLLLRYVFDKSKPIPIKPFPANTQHCLVFYLKGCVMTYNSETNVYNSFAKISLNGSQITRFDFHLSQDYLMFSVNFQPNVLSKFLRLPLTEFINDRIDAEAILNPEINQVYENMTNAINYEHIVKIAEEYLWKRIQKVKIAFDPIDKVALLLNEKPSIFSVEKLADLACLSISQLERRFINETGISPKFYARINRFSQAYSLKEKQPNTDWLGIALETGYHDYQHLVKDFKQFSGTTPNSLLQAQAKSPEKVLGII